MSRNYEISVREFLQLSREGSIDYADFIEHFMRVLRKVNEKFGFIHTIAEVDKESGEGLYGLPVSVKDNICVKGLQSSAGSRILDGYVPFFDATCIKKVRALGGKIIGKTNQDEFGFGTFSVNSGYEVPKNPLDPERTCGGSSGGAAGLAKAIRMPHIALAESTGGSISCPASFCGVVGLTPTYGLVSRYGLIDYANSLDKIGPIGDTVEDVALMLSIISGHDARDSTSIMRKHTTDYTKHVKKSIKGMKIGIPKEYFKNIDPKVKKKVEGAIDKLEELGAKTKKISLPTTRFALSAYYIIATSEASTNLAKYCGLRYGAHAPLEGNFNEYFSHVRTKYVGEEAKRRIILGTFARMSGYRDAYYLKAMKVRTLIINDFKKAFKKFDVLAAPTMPILPPRFKDIEKLKPVQHYQMDVLTVPPNLAGIPMISVPCGSVGSLPVGLHLMADHLQEGKIIEAASALENLLVKR